MSGLHQAVARAIADADGVHHDTEACKACQRRAAAAIRVLAAEQDAWHAAGKRAGYDEGYVAGAMAEAQPAIDLLREFDAYASLDGGPSYAGSPFQKRVLAALAALAEDTP